MSILLKPWPFFAGLLVPTSILYYSLQKNEFKNRYIRSSLEQQTSILNKLDDQGLSNEPRRYQRNTPKFQDHIKDVSFKYSNCVYTFI